MVNFWKKKIKDTNAIANKMGVEESKIKELVNGEREIEGETLDKVLQIVQDEKVNESIKNVEILQWYRDTDITALRKKFGYKTQKEFAKLLGYDISVINRIENKTAEWKNKDGKFNGVPVSLKRVYYFFQNDFNRKSKNNVVIQDENTAKQNDIYKWYKTTDIRSLRGNLGLKEQAIKIGLPLSSLNDVENKKPNRITKNIIKVYEFYTNTKVDFTDTTNSTNKKQDKKIWNWYKKTNILELRIKLGMTQQEVSRLIGMSQPCIGDVENKKNKNVTKTMKKLYEFYNQADIVEKATDTTPNEDDEIMNWYNSIEDLREYGRKFGYSKNKLMAVLNLSYDQIRDFERHNYKKVNSTMKKAYEFYHNEDNRLPEIELNNYNFSKPTENDIVENKVEENTEIVEELPYEIKVNQEKAVDYKAMYEDILAEFDKQSKLLAELNMKNYELRMQIKRYEKLIDRL